MKLIDDLRNRLTPKTPADRERVKKIAVYTVLCLSCLVCIWLIFAPSGDDETVAGKANTELPDGTTNGMPDSKIAAYEQDAQNKEKETRQAQLESISATLDTVAAQPTTDMPDAIQSSADAYQQAQASLQDFYIPEPLGEAQQVAELQERIAELEMQQSMPDYNHKSPDEMELLERSYQLAAQYMGNGNGGNYQPPQPQEEEKGKRNVQPVAQVSRNVVSSLGSSSNRGFNTSVGVQRTSSTNTISAVVANDQTIANGQPVRLRLTEPMWVGNRLVPRNTIITGESRLQGERLEIEISSVESEGSVYEVELQVFDSDGQEGINIPNSMESDALKEIGANMGSTVGSSINISTNAGAQIVSDVGRGILNGVSSYLTKKVREVKVHLKAGYKVMLHQPEQN
jgi:conjugative transposon TraM protein